MTQSIITYNGDNQQALADALATVKPGSTFEPNVNEDHVSFDQILADGSVIPGRWVMRLGDALDPNTGAVYGQDGELADQADMPRTDSQVHELLVTQVPVVQESTGSDPADVR